MAVVAIVLCLARTASAQAPIVPGDMNVHWDEGAANCEEQARPPLQVHAYNATTYVLRECPCATWEAPFVYLLVGETRALLIDTGDVADSTAMPLARTVMGLLPAGIPLLVVHTHRHLDHRAGDPQFAGIAQVVGYDLESVKRFYHFDHWPEGRAQLELGGRVVDVLPTPGHNGTEICLYDRQTALLFSGDFLMPARLLIDDASAARASARRAVEFLKDRPLRAVLGGHIEEDAGGTLFPWESHHHPNEHVLQLTKADLLALPDALSRFNGFYTATGGFVMLDSMRILGVFAAAIVIVLGLLAWGLVWFFRRRRGVRAD